MPNGFEERLKYICILQGSLNIGPANARRRYIVTSSFIGWVHTQNDPSFLGTEVVLVVEIFHGGRRGPIYPTLSKSWPMMTWLFALPGHQQPWYWPCSSGILWGNETIVRPSYLYNENSTHWGRDKMAAIFQMTFSNRFSWMKMYEFRLIFHGSLFPRVKLTIFQHWFR